MEISRIKVFGWENAIYGMRLPKDSEGQSDSNYSQWGNDGHKFEIGLKDTDLLRRLTLAGIHSKSHRKVLRMVHVQAAITMPISWWIQMDTYKIGTTANSRSRMHKMGSRLLTMDDFYVDNWNSILESTLYFINRNIEIFQNKKNAFSDEEKSEAWRNIIDVLPMSYQQERMWDANYEVLMGILIDRYNEKLKNEWRFFCDKMLLECPNLADLYIWEKEKRNARHEQA